MKKITNNVQKMEFVKEHKVGVLVGAGVAVAAVVGGVLIWKNRSGSGDVDPDSSCSRPAPAARYTTGAEGYGYGDANDIDGETSLIAGYDVTNVNMKIGAYHTTWGANRSNMLLVVNAPNTEDGTAAGIKAECRTIVIPLDGWEDSVLKDLYVDPDQQISAKLPGGERMCVKVKPDDRSGMLNVAIYPAGNVYFPVGFVIPPMNLKLVAKPVQEMI